MKKLKLMGLLGITFVLMISCKSEGCTDFEAANYNTEANTNDGTCVYNGSAAFWYKQETSDYLNDVLGATSLKYYVNDKFMGMSGTDIYFETSPDCGALGVLNAEDTFNETGASHTYSVLDQDDNVVWSGNITYIANECVKRQLTF